MKGRWALGPEVKRGALVRGAMLYDGSRASNLTAEWFSPGYWQSKGVLESTDGGRGAAYFFSAAFQFTTTFSGGEGGGAGLLVVAIRKRFPSPVTSYSKPPPPGVM